MIKLIYSKNILNEREMVKKGETLSEETRKKMILSHKGMLGKKHSEESKEKNRQKHLGKHFSPQTEFKKGSSGFIGKHTQETKELISKTKKERGQIVLEKNRGIKKGDKQRPETISKIKYTLNLPEIKSMIKERQTSPESINKMRQSRAKQIFPLKDTKIEIKIQNFLDKLRIEYFTHKYIGDITHAYQCDIFIPIQEGIIQKTIIECDGDYWHGNILRFSKLNKMQEEQVEQDRIRTRELQEKGFKVIRLWETDIKKMYINNFKEVIYEKNLH